MAQAIFDGQQSDERILSTVRPNRLKTYTDMAVAVILVIFFTAVIFGVSSLLPQFTGVLRAASAVGGIGTALLALWWIRIRDERSVSYVTDRRLIRFDAATPFFMAKRSLFWNEVLKAKAYSPNVLLRFLRLGYIVVEPHLSESENIVLKDVYMYEDLANYIDKILFIFKNKPAELEILKPFVAKPKGMRG